MMQVKLLIIYVSLLLSRRDYQKKKKKEVNFINIIEIWAIIN